MPPSLPTPARLRALGARHFRRLGLVPGGEPDGLGEDDRVAHLALGQRVAVFFPEPPVNAYQLEQWLPALEHLDAERGVVVLTQDSRTTFRLRQRTGLPVLCAARTGTLERLVRQGALGLVLYVSHHPRNFHMLRFGSLAHAFLGHGDSDKAVSVSNQLKAYDRVFVAGQAAVDRISDALHWFDVDKLVHIGRPQVAEHAAVARPPRPADAATVLYAPTWEGAQGSMAYSSVASHGLQLVRSLRGAGLRVVYRPHPRTGANRRDVGEADRRLREELSGASSGAAVISTGAPLASDFAEADVLITDVSSVAVEWLPTGRPLVVTVPSDAAAVVGPSRLLETVPRLTAQDAGVAGELVRDLLRSDTTAAARATLREYYLGAASDGGPAAQFLAACADTLAARDAAVAGAVQACR